MDYLAERDTENGEQVLPKKPVMGLGLLEGIQSKRYTKVMEYCMLINMNDGIKFCLLCSGEHVVIYNDNEAEENVLSLDELGTVLKRLSEQLPGIYNRKTLCY